jgi:hypothetical protein
MQIYTIYAITKLPILVGSVIDTAHVCKAVSCIEIFSKSIPYSKQLYPTGQSVAELYDEKKSEVRISWQGSFKLTCCPVSKMSNA